MNDIGVESVNTTFVGGPNDGFDMPFPIFLLNTIEYAVISGYVLDVDLCEWVWHDLPKATIVEMKNDA